MVDWNKDNHILSSNGALEQFRLLSLSAGLEILYIGAKIHSSVQ